MTKQQVMKLLLNRSQQNFEKWTKEQVKKIYLSFLSLSLTLNLNCILHMQQKAYVVAEQWCLHSPESY